MSAQKKEINLLPVKGLQSGTLGRVLVWILSSFRIIVIVTEIIVMIAFFSRFWLDARHSDLNDEIDHKKAVITASLDFENNFKDVQKRLSVFENLVMRTQNSITVGTITKFLPSDILLSRITLNESSSVIEGFSPNELSIQQLLVSMHSSDIYESVDLQEIKSEKNSSLLKFKISFKLKTNQERSSQGNES